MISDADLYRLAMFLGVIAMIMIVIYHFLEVNAKDDVNDGQVPALKTAKSGAAGSGDAAGARAPSAPGAAAAGGSSGSGRGADN